MELKFLVKKNSNKLPQNKSIRNSNFNPLTQNMSNYLESKKLKKRILFISIMKKYEINTKSKKKC